MYQVIAKLAHGLYHSATVVDFNLILKILMIGDVKYPASTRLQWIGKSYKSSTVQTSTVHM